MPNPFHPTPRLQEAAKIINSLDEAILPRIMKRLCKEIEVAEAFSSNELIKMQDTLGLDSQQVNLVLKTLNFIIQQAAHHLMKPALLSENLKAIGLNEQSSISISEAWGLHAKSIVDKLKKVSIIPGTVESIESSVHLHLSSHIGGQAKVPVARIQLNLESQSAEGPTHLDLEFTESQLKSFYQTLENIQSQLDQIV